jgi:hypothetical protein
MERDVSGLKRDEGCSVPVLLVREFAAFREEIPRLMRRMDWEKLVASLGRLNQMSESAGYREICLRSQAVIELMGRRGAGRDEPGERVISLIDSLLGVLAHCEWREKERIGNGITFSNEPLYGWENPGAHDSPAL